MFMDWLKKAPTSVKITMIVVCGLLAGGVLAAYVILSLNQVDTTELRQWINTIGQLLVFPLLGTTAVASISAARSASRADDQTNGQLAAKDRELAAARAREADLRRQLDARR